MFLKPFARYFTFILLLISLNVLSECNGKYVSKAEFEFLNYIEALESNENWFDDDKEDWEQKPHGVSSPIIAVIVILVAILILILIVKFCSRCCCCCCKKQPDKNEASATAPLLQNQNVQSYETVYHEGGVIKSEHAQESGISNPAWQVSVPVQDHSSTPRLTTIQEPAPVPYNPYYVSNTNEVNVPMGEPPPSYFEAVGTPSSSLSQQPNQQQSVLQINR